MTWENVNKAQKNEDVNGRIFCQYLFFYYDSTAAEEMKNISNQTESITRMCAPFILEEKIIYRCHYVTLEVTLVTFHRMFDAELFYSVIWPFIILPSLSNRTNPNAVNVFLSHFKESDVDLHRVIVI